MCYYVYILYSAKLDTYYRGQTKDINDRLNRHNQGYEKSTRGGAPWKLIWSTRKSSRSEAVLLESKLKNLSRKKMERFIEHHMEGVAGPDALNHVCGFQQSTVRGQDADR